ncbi:thiamine biosynthesis lipoprotein [Dysgonomonas sp. PH5-45]|uniref:FAD:protein FMN transferase n=1 Tax=unclassified Dysgonomonas TaxID=2630389 RepID=UPI00247480B8|nr:MULTISPECIES: FAD:protein FMN transferase [unclassified Dysgonomonas]MDH6354790.1 thiamine biosynthesis lipoprotein [Dysgonomonas sp. PH5-45]MDH6387689.1 thiamine biosynthesis lipoprotein [Dysgonomonas sp. PH5-37]
MSHRLYKTQTRFLFHAHIKLKFSAFYGDELFDELFAVLEEADRLYNSYSPGSFISKINREAGAFADADNETVGILKQVKEISDIFNGEYDITIMPLIRLWGFYKDEGRTIPTIEEIEETKKLVNYKRIEIKENQVKIDKGQELITGSFIKAYAVDRMVDRMRQIGVQDAIINAGGSTIKTLTDEGHPFWQVLVKHPEKENEMFRLKLSGQCFSTSAQSKTFVEIDGRRYGHIISPKSGYPSENKQVGIVSDDCFTGDAVSTALFNLSGKEFLNKMECLSPQFNIEGFMIDGSDTVFYTEGFKKYIIG